MSRNIDLNTVNEQELQRLQGIGKDPAKNIVDFRRQHGPFKNWEDLKRVPGLTQEMIETLKRDGATIAGRAA